VITGTWINAELTEVAIMCADGELWTVDLAQRANNDGAPLVYREPPVCVERELRGKIMLPLPGEAIRTDPKRFEPSIGQGTAECRCVVSCADDPPTMCSLSGEAHVHPDNGSDTFGACPLHPDAPGDL
jgi:hypothetical protein